MQQCWHCTLAGRRIVPWYVKSWTKLFVCFKRRKVDFRFSWAWRLRLICTQAMHTRLILSIVTTTSLVTLVLASSSSSSYYWLLLELLQMNFQRWFSFLRAPFAVLKEKEVNSNITMSFYHTWTQLLLLLLLLLLLAYNGTNKKAQMLSPLAEIVKHKTTKCIQLANDTVSRKQMVLSAFADAHSDSGLPDVLKTHVHASGLNVFIPLHLKRKVLKGEIHWKRA